MTNVNWKVGFLLMVMTSGVGNTGFPAERAGVPSHSVSLPTPEIKSAQGSITVLNFHSQIPTLKLSAADGKIRTVSLDPKATRIWRRNQLVSLNQLKVGDRVRVRYIEKGRREIAKSIEMA